MKTATATFALVLTITANLFAVDDVTLIGLQQEAVRAACKRVAPSVVQIETLGGSEQVRGQLISSGPTTGLVVSEDGLIVSSAFGFIQSPDSILVTLPDGQRKSAEIVARDLSRMTVLLRVATESPLPVPTLSPRESWRAGQTTIAIGKTFSREQVNLSVGILSAKDRIWSRAVQTDANVSPANYGGPLIDLNGRVIGLLVPLSPEGTSEVAGAEWYDSGIGFAVPLERVFQKLSDWSGGEDLLPGRLGVTLGRGSELDPPAEVGVVKLNSPAADIGLKTGDQIVRINDTTIERVSQMRHALGPLYANDSITLRVLRKNKPLDFATKLIGKIPPYEHAFLGILPSYRDAVATAEDVKPSDTKSADDKTDTERVEPDADKSADGNGVLVRFIFADSGAARAGIQIGDRIEQLNETNVSTAEEFRQAMAQFQPGESIKVTFQRDGNDQTADATLSRLPESIPEELASEQADTPLAEDAIKVGQIDFGVPEEPNQCTAFVPESIRTVASVGLIVVLQPPGDIDIESVVADWKPTCERFGLVLLVPEPNNKSRWSSTESAVVAKLIERARKRFGISEQRVAVVGTLAGGTMAYITGVRHREAIDGIAVLDGVTPGSIDRLENEPLERLAILHATSKDSDVAAQMTLDARAFRKAKFPVTQLTEPTSGDDWSARQREAIGRWITTFDRL